MASRSSPAGGSTRTLNSLNTSRGAFLSQSVISMTTWETACASVSLEGSGGQDPGERFALAVAKLFDKLS